MRSFRDNTGRAWKIQANTKSVKEVRILTGFDLGAAIRSPGLGGLSALLGNIPLTVDVLYVLCRPECERRGVSDEDFGRALVGDPIEHAAYALIDALIDYVPGAAERSAILGITEKGRAAVARAAALEN